MVVFQTMAVMTLSFPFRSSTLIDACRLRRAERYKACVDDIPFDCPLRPRAEGTYRIILLVYGSNTNKLSIALIAKSSGDGVALKGQGYCTGAALLVFDSSTIVRKVGGASRHFGGAAALSENAVFNSVGASTGALVADLDTGNALGEGGILNCQAAVTSKVNALIASADLAVVHGQIDRTGFAISKEDATSCVSTNACTLIGAVFENNILRHTGIRSITPNSEVLCIIDLNSKVSVLTCVARIDSKLAIFKVSAVGIDGDILGDI